MSAFWVTTAWLTSVVAMNDLGLAHRAIVNPWTLVASLTLAGTVLVAMVLWPLRVLGGESASLAEAVANLVGRRLARIACAVVLVALAVNEIRRATSLAPFFLWLPFGGNFGEHGWSVASLVFALFCCATMPRGGGIWGSARLLGVYGLMLALGTLIRFGPGADTSDPWGRAVSPETPVRDLSRVAMPFLLLSSGLWRNGSPPRTALLDCPSVDFLGRREWKRRNGSDPPEEPQLRRAVHIRQH